MVLSTTLLVFFFHLPARTREVHTSRISLKSVRFCVTSSLHFRDGSRPTFDTFELLSRLLMDETQFVARQSAPHRRVNHRITL